MAAMLAATPALAAAEKQDDSTKVICKRFPVTGSLVQSTRECKTKADWERAAEGSQREMERRMEMKGFSVDPGGG
jgi:hypothetical protein